MAGTIRGTGVNGGSVETPARPSAEASGADTDPSAGPTPRAQEVATRSLEQTRTWLSRRRTSADAAFTTTHFTTRDWLVRAAFGLFAVMALASLVFAAVGLLSLGELATLVAPVAVLAAAVVGFYLGSEHTRT